MANSQLYLWDDRFLWLGESFTADFTGRYAVTLVVSLAGRPIRVTLENGETLETYALLTAPKLRRALDARDTSFLSLNWDPHSFEFHALSNMLERDKLLCFERETVAPLLDEFSSFLSRSPSCEEVAEKCADLFHCLCPEQSTQAHQDARVLRVAALLRQELPRNVDAVGLAAEVGLSVDRLTHLFSEQMGMSMRNYLLWAKGRRAVSQLLIGGNLTEVAHDCGFADSAHFTRALRESYDVTPSMLADVKAVDLYQCA